MSQFESMHQHKFTWDISSTALIQIQMPSFWVYGHVGDYTSFHLTIMICTLFTLCIPGEFKFTLTEVYLQLQW